LFTLSKLVQAGNQIGVQGLGAVLGKQQPNPAAKLGPVPAINFLAGREDIMSAMKRKGKGGDGIHPDLQTTARLAGASNGIEEKIKLLRLAKLTVPRMTKESKQLALMAYKIAGLAQLAREWSAKIPRRAGQKTRKDWQRWSNDMRDEALRLAAAAEGLNVNQVFAVAKKLDNTCVTCHKVFK
jgi:hypothetical protein